MDMEPGDRIKVVHDGGVFEGVFRELTQRVEQYKPPRWTFEMDNATIEIDGAFSECILEKHLVMPKAKPGDVILLDGHHPVLCWRTNDGNWDVIGNTISENDVPDPVAWARGHSWHVDKVVKYGAVS